jgi:hypothetical protein
LIPKYFLVGTKQNGSETSILFSLHDPLTHQPFHFSAIITTETAQRKAKSFFSIHMLFPDQGHCLSGQKQV